MSDKKARRTVVTEMFEAIEKGESYTILKDGAPAAMVLPWADWLALQGHWLDLLKPMRTAKVDDAAKTQETAKVAEIVEPIPTASEPGIYTDYRPPGVYADGRGPRAQGVFLDGAPDYREPL